MAIYSIYIISRTDHPTHVDDSTVLYLSAVVIAESEEAARAMHPAGYDDADENGDFHESNNWVKNVAVVEVCHIGIADPDSEVCVLLASTSAP